MAGNGIKKLEVGRELRELNIKLRVTSNDLIKEYTINNANFLREICRDSEFVKVVSNMTSCQYSIDSKIIIGYLGDSKHCTDFDLILEIDDLSDILFEIEVNGEVYKSTDFQLETFNLLCSVSSGKVIFTDIGIPYVAGTLNEDCNGEDYRIYSVSMPIDSKNNINIVYNVYRSVDDSDILYELKLQME